MKYAKERANFDVQSPQTIYHHKAVFADQSFQPPVGEDLHQWLLGVAQLWQVELYP